MERATVAPNGRMGWRRVATGTRPGGLGAEGLRAIRDVAGVLRGVTDRVEDPVARARLRQLADDLVATTVTTPAEDVWRRLGTLRREVDQQAAGLGAGAQAALRAALDAVERSIMNDIAAAGGQVEDVMQAGRAEGDRFIGKGRAEAESLLHLGRADAEALLEQGHADAEDLLDQADLVGQRQVDRAERAGRVLLTEAAERTDASVDKAIRGVVAGIGAILDGTFGALTFSAGGIALGAGIALLAGAALPVVAVAGLAGLAVGLGAWLLRR